MSAGYGRIAFTDDVADVQEQHGSRRFYGRRRSLDEHRGDVAADALTGDVRDYLAERDSFYLASVSASGWPYVQHRGGPPGFVKVLDEHRIGWADFRGNFQYISVGNLHGEHRVALILMDYPARARLKIYGRATVVDADDQPETMAQLTDDRYEAVVERGIVVEVAAFDWNCRQHITPRYTAAELQPHLDDVRQQLVAAEAENDRLRRLLSART